LCGTLRARILVRMTAVRESPERAANGTDELRSVFSLDTFNDRMFVTTSLVSAAAIVFVTEIYKLILRRAAPATGGS